MEFWCFDVKSNIDSIYYESIDEWKMEKQEKHLIIIIVILLWFHVDVMRFHHVNSC